MRQPGDRQTKDNRRLAQQMPRGFALFDGLQQHRRTGTGTCQRRAIGLASSNGAVARTVTSSSRAAFVFMRPRISIAANLRFRLARGFVTILCNTGSVRPGLIAAADSSDLRRSGNPFVGSPASRSNVSNDVVARNSPSSSTARSRTSAAVAFAAAICVRRRANDSRCFAGSDRPRSCKARCSADIAATLCAVAPLRAAPVRPADDARQRIVVREAGDVIQIPLKPAGIRCRAFQFREQRRRGPGAFDRAADVGQRREQRMPRFDRPARVVGDFRNPQMIVQRDSQRVDQMCVPRGRRVPRRQ